LSGISGGEKGTQRYGKTAEQIETAEQIKTKEQIENAVRKGIGGKDAL